MHVHSTAFALMKVLKIVETNQLWEHQSAEGNSVPHRKCTEDSERRNGRSRRGPRQSSCWYLCWLIEHMVDSVVQICAYSTVNGCVPTDA